MPTTNYTSRRGYLTQSELAEYADITITDPDEADDQINQAEEQIDAYVGYQQKAYPYIQNGRATAGGASSLTLQANQCDLYDIDYYKLCQVEIIGGTGVGQTRKVTSSTRAGVLTVDTAWATAPDSTSFYKIYQLGKFPRFHDVIYYTEQTPLTYYKSIPDAVKRAIAAQVEFRITMGPDFFETDQSEKISESIGDYSYQNAIRGVGSTGPDKLIAPKAKMLLRGIKSRLGQITT